MVTGSGEGPEMISMSESDDCSSTADSERPPVPGVDGGQATEGVEDLVGVAATGVVGAPGVPGALEGGGA